MAGFILSLSLFPMFTNATLDTELPLKETVTPSHADLFLVFGYGIPKDIFQDDNYKTYLGITFNTIFDQVQKTRRDAYIIFSGGKTAMAEPYTRSEAGEMKKYFEFLLERPFLNEYAKRVHLLTEEESYSTLENILFTKKITENKDINPENIHIFIEKNRKRRVEVLAKKIFERPAKVHAIDFDKNEARYMDPAKIRQKENMELIKALWALEKPENMQKYHELFKERINLLRKADPKDHAKIQQEFRSKLEKLGRE